MIDSTVVEATPALPGADGSAASVSLLQAVADPVRWAVLARLADGPHCVCDLQTHVPVAGNLMSYHLRVLREAGLVLTSRRGRWVDYALAPDARARLCAALPLPMSLPMSPSRSMSAPQGGDLRA